MGARENGMKWFLLVSLLALVLCLTPPRPARAYPS